MQNDYLYIAKEIKNLSLEGAFEKDAQKLYEIKDKVPMNEFLGKCLEDWSKDNNQYGKNDVKQLILIYLKLYIESISVGDQKSIDVLTHFYRGFPDNPETENLSSFLEFIRSWTDTRARMRKARENPDHSLLERKNLSVSIINSYSKGVEFFRKIFTSLILLL